VLNSSSSLYKNIKLFQLFLENKSYYNSMGEVMNILKELGFQKTRAELYIDEHRQSVLLDVIVKPEDYVNGTKCNPTKSPLALALQRAVEGTPYRVERAGFKVLVISRGIYEYCFFMPRRVWRKVSGFEFDDAIPSRPIKFTAEFEMIF
jgi:hypothetical protein